MSEITKRAKDKEGSQRGKAPKAGRGVGAKQKDIKTAVVSVRLPVDSIQLNLINANWLRQAVDLKLQQIEKKQDL